jgi:hypothetical protein
MNQFNKVQLRGPFQSIQPLVYFSSNGDFEEEAGPFDKPSSGKPAWTKSSTSSSNGNSYYAQRGAPSPSERNNNNRGRYSSEGSRSGPTVDL